MVRSARQNEVQIYSVGLLNEEDHRAAANAKHQLSELSDVQIYAIGIYEPTISRGRTVEESNGPALLTDLAEQTGGRQYQVENLAVGLGRGEMLTGDPSCARTPGAGETP